MGLNQPFSLIGDFAYDRLSPHQDIVSERLAILSNMPQKDFTDSASTLAQRVAPYSWVVGEHFDSKVGQKLDLETQKKQLVQAGYRLVDTVYDHGEFAVRGSIMDIMPLVKNNRFVLTYLMMKLIA